MMAGLIQPHNETFATYNRTTKDGRKLTYEMSVLQQPQRARACGSGAKSSADRRPVDPPPVVELKVFEGDSRKDITFQHNANFFLFTTLESARPIAPARGAATVPPPHPVLTGMPVAGMAYLDRPTQAGYFIFPDLSVRHEGKFRLSFNLYEQLKEAKDMDPEGAVGPSPAAHDSSFGGSYMSNTPEFVHFRMEVKSAPFTVYSAKKFPGLAESTQLSRLVAEQGCRVRIRRDVRMRRREAKPNKDFDAYSDDGDPSYARDRYATPDSYNQLAADRGSSNATSVVDPRSYSLERRQSGADLAGYYHQQQQYSQQPPAQSNNSSQLQYAPPSGSQYQQQQQQQPPPPPPSSYPAPSSQYSYPQPATTHVRQSSSSSNLAYSDQSSYPQPAQTRPTTQPGASSSQYEFPAVDTRFANLPPSEFSSSAEARSSTPSTHPQLPPLKDITDSKYTQSATPIPASSSATYDTYSTQTPPTSILAQHGKRVFGSTFDDGHVNTPLAQGTRPVAVGQDTVQVELEDGTLADPDEPNLLSYRRADGSRQLKKIPVAY